MVTAVQQQPRRSSFYVGIAVLFALTIFAGFAKSYYLQPLLGNRPLSKLLHMHGGVFTAWMLVFIAQTWLIKASNRTLHKQLGAVGGFLALAMIGLGLYTGAVAAARNPNPPLILAVSWFDIFMFVPLLVAGFYYRHRPQLHRPFMLLSTISLLDAGTARWPVWPFISSNPFLGGALAYLIRDLFAVAAMLYDRDVSGKIRPVYLWGTCALLVSDAVRMVVADTETWRGFTSAVISLL